MFLPLKRLAGIISVSLHEWHASFSLISLWYMLRHRKRASLAYTGSLGRRGRLIQPLRTAQDLEKTKIEVSGLSGPIQKCRASMRWAQQAIATSSGRRGQGAEVGGNSGGNPGHSVDLPRARLAEITFGNLCSGRSSQPIPVKDTASGIWQRFRGGVGRCSSDRGR